MTLYTACCLSHRYGPVQFPLRQPLRSCWQPVQSTAPPKLLHPELEPVHVATGSHIYSDASNTTFCSSWIPVIVYRWLLESTLLQLSLDREPRCRDLEPLECPGPPSHIHSTVQLPIRDKLSLRLLMEHIRSAVDSAAPLFSHNLNLLAQR